jgi:hypothetical protein
MTLGMLGLLGLSTQFLRHLYVRWIAPRTSVLDKYQEKTEKDIAASQSLDELLKQYDEAHRKVKKWEESKTQEERAKAGTWDEPHRSAEKLKEAITAWESRSREISELHFFWWCGLGCVGLGLVAFSCGGRWLGVAGITIGFAEMIYWTSPIFFGSGAEFERLLTWKLIYTGASLALLLCLWGYFVRRTVHAKLTGAATRPPET